MRLKKWLCVSLVLIMTLLLFAGCNPKTDEQIGTGEATKISDLAGANGTITVAVCTAAKPFVYRKNDQFVGYDIEFVTGFAREYGYAIQFEDMAFAAILGGVQSGKYDLGLSGITITEERREL